MRLVGERKACAAIVLGFFGSLFLLNGLFGPAPFVKMFVALGVAYLVGFFGVVSGWFWARWYAMGLAFSGVVTAAMGAWQIGLDPAVLFWGGTHAVAGLALVGRGPASAFDGRTDWRERFHMDDNAVNRLGKSVTRAGASLPYLIVYGLAPRQGMAAEALAVLALGAGIMGVYGLVRLRAWGLLALGAAAILAALGGPLDVLSPSGCPDEASFWQVMDYRWVPGVAVALAALAVWPFARPLWLTFRSAR